MTSERVGIIFDLDGTLIHSAPDVTRILNQVLETQNLEGFSEQDAAHFMGDGIGAIIEKAMRARGVDVTASLLNPLREMFLQIYMENPVVDTAPFPMVVNVLSELKQQGYAIGICTNKAERPARLIVERVGLKPLIQALVGGDSGYGYKPKADPLLACARLLGVQMKHVTYVGDLAVDLAAGRAAGAHVVLVRYGYSMTSVDDLGADAVIGCLSELPQRLRIAA
ncbi:MAG: HAD-IA family hydrolase [Hyphomicrobiaceae bacterium]